MLACLGILLALSALMYFAYLGYSVIFFAPIFALMAAAFSGLSILPTYTELFLPSLASYVKVYFPFFLLGAVFGKMMELSGAAESISKAIIARLGTRHAMLAVVLACAVLTYGGVSLFVVAFAVYPFGAAIFKEADIPKRLLPPTIALGAFTFTMDALPGTPQIQNSIPMKFFNTDLYAAPVFGSFGAALVLTIGLYYLERARRKAMLAGEGYGNHDHAPVTPERVLPHPALAILPLLAVLVVTLMLQKMVFPAWDISTWATASPYKMDPDSLTGSKNNWALIFALGTGIAITLGSHPIPWTRRTFQSDQRRCNRIASCGHEHGVRSGIWKRRQIASRLQDDRQWSDGNSRRGRSTPFGGGHRQRACRSDRLGIRRDEHRS